MELFPRYVELKDTTQTHRRFEYDESSGWTRCCYLKIDIHDNVPVFYCSELVNHPRGDVVEEPARRRAIEMLCNEGLIVSTRPRVGLDLLSRRRFREKQWQDIMELFDERSIWITHGLAENDYWAHESFTIVYFKCSFILCTDLEAVIEMTGLEPSFFEIDPKEFYFERV